MDESRAVADGGTGTGDTPAPVGGTDRRDPGGPRRTLIALLVGVALLVLVVDQVSKYLVVRDLQPDETVSVISGVLRLHLIRNPGAAFSMATGMTWIFTVIAIAVSVLIARISARLGSRWWALALGLLLGGAIGNLTDRLFREPGFARGHVVDFIEYQKFPFMDFPIFNVADSCIVCSAVLIALLGLRGIGLDGSRLTDRPAGGTTPGPDRADG